jgi:hypothetical protein
MTTGPRLISTRRALLAACCLAALVAIFATIGNSAQASGPDVTVFSFTDIASYGSADGFVGYAIGTRSCNRGDTPLNWCSFSSSSNCAPGAGLNDHPVIAQNLYRLKNGRFDQIGMSWLKHGFESLNSTTTGCAGSAGQSCQQPPGGDAQLGVGCTDPYTAGLNGFQPLAPRSEVNATTGVFPSPSFVPGPYEVYEERIKVAIADVDPALNSGATYWAEGQYIARDDASARNSFNNASHRQVTASGGPDYPLTMSGTFFEGQPAIYAWRAQDPAVELVTVDIPGLLGERFDVARKVTSLGGGTWHYEYAVHNLNSDRSARAFSVQFPQTTNFTDVGFKDIEHHSGEPYAVDDWLVSSSTDLISWSTDTFAVDPNANAIRWATMFNFWFNADQPPAGTIHKLDLFKPGTPAAIEFTIGSELFKDGFESGNTGAWGGSFRGLEAKASPTRLTSRRASR